MGCELIMRFRLEDFEHFPGSHRFSFLLRLSMAWLKKKKNTYSNNVLIKNVERPYRKWDGLHDCNSKYVHCRSQTSHSTRRGETLSLANPEASKQSLVEKDLVREFLHQEIHVVQACTKEEWLKIQEKNWNDVCIPFTVAQHCFSGDSVEDFTSSTTHSYLNHHFECSILFGLLFFSYSDS